MNTKKGFIIFIVILVIIVGGIGFVSNQNKTPVTKLGGFAQCLSDSGAKFYGTFWCSHCQAQKRMFGQAQKYLPYIECSTPNGQGQLQVCKDAGIEAYPTWTFVDGSRLTGELSLETLSEKTSCPLPQ